MIFRCKRKTATPGKAMEPPTPFPEFGGFDPEGRARGLLLSMLTKSERAQFEKYGYVEVTAKSGRRYRLTSNGAPYLMKDKTGNERYLCVYPWDAVLGRAPPGPDRVLALMLHIRADEIAFLRIAVGHDERV